MLLSLMFLINKSRFDTYHLMINVLEIINDLGIGGTQKNMQTICKYLGRDRFKVYACALFCGGSREPMISDTVEELIIAYGDENRVIDLIKDRNIRAVHFHGIDIPNSVNTRKTLKILSFCRRHNIRTVETAPFPFFNVSVEALLDIKLLKSQACLLKYLHKNRKQIEDPRKYGLMYNSMDLAELQKHVLSSAEVASARHRIGISSTDFVLGKVGRATLWKWDDMILDVVPLLKPRIPDLKVIVRAIPEHKKRKVKRMGLEPCFRYLPETSSEREVCETYQMMDVMVHTSRIGETFGMALAECLFFGKPIITNSTDFRNKLVIFDRDNAQVEMVEHGVNGFVENDRKKAAQRILALYSDDDLYSRISANNRRKARQFDGTVQVKQLEQILAGGAPAPVSTLTINEYKRSIPKELFGASLRINIRAIYDKYFVEKLNTQP